MFRCYCYLMRAYLTFPLGSPTGTQAGAQAQQNNLSPLDIATHAQGDQMNLQNQGEGGVKERIFAEEMNLPALFNFLKREVLLVSTIAILVTLISMLFVTKAEKLADKKENIMHKLMLVFLASSTIWLLDVFVTVLSMIF